MLNRIWVGTANWTDHTGFYPRGTRPQDRLAYYAERLPMVEVNASFYLRIKPRDYAQRAKHTPDHFGFVVKAHRAVCQRPRDASLIDQCLQSQRHAVDPLRDAGKFLGFLAQFGTNVPPNVVRTLARVAPVISRLFSITHLPRTICAEWSAAALPLFSDGLCGGGR